MAYVSQEIGVDFTISNLSKVDLPLRKYGKDERDYFSVAGFSTSFAANYYDMENKNGRVVSAILADKMPHVIMASSSSNGETGSVHYKMSSTYSGSYSFLVECLPAQNDKKYAIEIKINGKVVVNDSGTISGNRHIVEAQFFTYKNHVNDIEITGKDESFSLRKIGWVRNTAGSRPTNEFIIDRKDMQFPYVTIHVNMETYNSTSKVKKLTHMSSGKSSPRHIKDTGVYSFNIEHNDKVDFKPDAANTVLLSVFSVGDSHKNYVCWDSIIPDAGKTFAVGDRSVISPHMDF